MSAALFTNETTLSGTEQHQMDGGHGTQKPLGGDPRAGSIPAFGTISPVFTKRFLFSARHRAIPNGTRWHLKP